MQGKGFKVHKSEYPSVKQSKKPNHKLQLMKAQIRITRIRNIAGKTLRIDSSGLERLRNVKESIMDSVTLRPIKFKYSIVFWHQLNQHFHIYQELKDLRIFFASFLCIFCSLFPIHHSEKMLGLLGNLRDVPQHSKWL